MSRASARTSAAIAALLLVAAVSGAAERYDPRLRFCTTRTEHFDIHAHQGEEALARRLAGIAERVRAKMEPEMGRPRGRVQVILVDQADLSNGWATPFPYDTIEITAAAAASESLIGNTTDWLELVFTHEYTHILHLDRTRGFMQGVRRTFGRIPLAFPNSFLPVWQVEGIATYEESRMTGEGRVPAGDFRAIVDVAAAAGRFEPIDRASGGLTDWPAGQAAYAYGAYFHQFLADHYGPERLARLADATAGRVPLFGAGAFPKVFGKRVEAIWKEFAADREALVPVASETDARAVRLTYHGFVVSSARRGEEGTLYYGVSNPDGFPALMRLAPGSRPVRLAWRPGGEQISVRGPWIVFDRVERVRSAALYADLYAVRRDDDDVHRLTRDARASDPDLSPDGRSIVCTIQAAGRRTLALVDFTPDTVSSPRVLVDDPDADFTGPRWSPDGRRIVAARRRRGAYDLVSIDPATREVRPLLSRADARLVTPTWSNGDTILFAADPGDGPFNIFALDLPSGIVRQVTDTVGGAKSPELTPDGTLTYVGYTPDGYDVFSIRVEPATWRGLAPSPTPEPTNPQNPENPQNPGNPQNPENSESYSPLRTLVPTYWTPLVSSDSGETVFGAATAMSDALGRHGYAADAGWSVSRARPDWRVSYAYDRWRPTLFASYADDTDPIRGGELRTRELFAGALLRFRHLRYSESFIGGFHAETDSLACAAQCRAPSATDFRSLRAGWLHDSRRQFGYSISDEEGFAVESAIESSRTALGSDANRDAVIFDGRLFQRAFSRHTVFAARAAFAGSWGDVDSRRVFSAAGAGPSYPVFDFGRDTIGLLRGFAPEDVVGTRAATINLDLRVPLTRPQRGPGSFPFFLHSVHGAAFVDAANAWDATFRSADIKSSVGGEVSADIVLVHYLPLTIAGGAAWTRDPSVERSRGAFFGRVGYAF